jgi:hypothetical protein
MLPMHKVNRILDEIGPGDPHAAVQILPLVYDELSQRAAQRRTEEREARTAGAATSLPPRPCAASSSNGLATRGVNKRAAGAGSLPQAWPRPERVPNCIFLAPRPRPR